MGFGCMEEGADLGGCGWPWRGYGGMRVRVGGCGWVHGGLAKVVE